MERGKWGRLTKSDLERPVNGKNIFNIKNTIHGTYDLKLLCMDEAEITKKICDLIRKSREDQVICLNTFIGLMGETERSFRMDK